MPQSLANTYIHLIFSTKNRQPLLTDKIRPELHAYMATTLANLNSPATIINSVTDHIHILFNLSRTTPLSKAVEEIKKSSSKWLKTKSPDLSNFTWQAGYGAFSVSQSHLPIVAKYIANQEQHHKKLTFKQELRQFLEKNKLSFDEQYLWD